MQTQTTLLLGAHCSIAGGFHNALEITHKLNANCLQIFVRNQRQWRAPAITEEQLEYWNATKRKFEKEISHIIAHASYLINLASDNSETRKRSIKSLHEELQRARKLGISRYVLHPGNHKGQGLPKGIELIAKALDEILPEFSDITILLETTAGAGTSIGSTIEEIAEIISKSKYPERIGCCLDTCHLFVSGYDLSTEKKFDSFIKKLDNLLELRKIGCVHMNDSIGKFRSHLDRHWHIGKGNIDINVFKYVLNSQEFMNVPKIIETPKSDCALENDLKNLGILKSLFCN